MAGILDLMFLSAPFRALIAALVVVGMQLCCCSTAWLVCASCDDCAEGELSVVSDGYGHDPAAADDHHASAQPDIGMSADEQHTDGSPCGGHNGDPDKGKCTCLARDPKPRPPEASKVDLPAPVLVAIVPTWDAVSFGVQAPWNLGVIDKALVQTSLLRQHCALTI